MSLIDSLATAWRTKRRKLAPLVVAAAVLLIGRQLEGAIPREVHLRYELGPTHGALHEARIGYRLDGEEMKAVRFAYAHGAPSSIDHQVTLSPGRYEIVAELHGGASGREVVRALEVPADGIVRVDLFGGSSP
jgi:hypothetical protein